MMHYFFISSFDHIVSQAISVSLFLPTQYHSCNMYAYTSLFFVITVDSPFMNISARSGTESAIQGPYNLSTHPTPVKALSFSAVDSGYGYGQGDSAGNRAQTRLYGMIMMSISWLILNILSI